ncbi:hypothetical protein JWG40_04095 [Leptospira sp. 201903074]|uniref:hypothetical protein n=1 Tax=Leptospira abararensis TaxID=2810036 RepID=UPI001963945E|nr:hypothetical protein [Leptospira abararensis]MBM9546182.1 hypothetical protein [Leptospira abararensis]
MFGKDIYWYGVQAISLLETGKLHSPDPSPVFHIVAFLFQILGTSDESLFLFQILTVIWLLVSLFFARKLVFHHWEKTNTNAKSGSESNKNHSVRKKIITLWIPSVMIFVLSFLYPKQSWALGFLLLAIGFYFSNQIRWKWIYVGICFLCAAWFHSMVGFLGLGIWIFYQVPKKFYPFLFLSVLLIPLVLPANIGGRFHFDTEAFPLSVALGIAGVGILWDWFFLVFGKNVPQSFQQVRSTIAFLGLLLVVPLFHFADIQYRILLSILLIKEIFTNTNWKQSIVTGVSILLWSYTLYQHPNLFRHPYEQMWNPGEGAAEIPNNGLLVAHHGFCEFYHFQFRKDCLSWEPDEKALSELPSNTKIYRLVYGIRFENLRASKMDPNTPIFSYLEPLGEYQLVLEEDWKRYRLWLEKRNSKLLPIAKSWKNPYRERPHFIKRKQTYGI